LLPGIQSFDEESPMHGFGRATVTTAALILVVPAIAGAQQKCEIDEGKPNQVATASFFVSAAYSDPGKDHAKQLKSAVKSLTEKAEKFESQPGRNLVLGKALVAWADQPNATPVMKRGDVGYTTNPDVPVDVLLAADSAFTRVETALPQCAAEISMYRRQKPWVAAVNGAVEALNAGQLDSAEARANRSLVIYRGAPYAYTVLAGIRQQRGDNAGAVEMLKKAVEASKSDTAFADLGRQSLLNVGSITTDLADKAPVGPERTRLAREAEAAFRRYVAENPNDPSLPAAQSGIARALVIAGDTASVTAMYTEMLANPAKYRPMQLFEAGVVAARADKAKDAAALFEAGLKTNPYYRDALFNLAAVYFAQDQYDSMIPVLNKLISVDPNNPENYRMLAGAYQGKARATKDPKVKRALNDSLLKAFEKFDKAPVVVAFTLFSHDGPKHKLNGTIENRGEAAKPYNLKVEFLDAQGNVVATKETMVGPVDPKGKKNFSIEVEQDGIVAYRYAPLG
jgi:tetratricopeptide (TPR) repeat protein